MASEQDLIQVHEYLYEIPASHREDMRVPARLYGDHEIMQATLADRSLEQLINVATLPGIVGHALAMPDIHQGYGFPIGGVAATLLPDGAISPGGVGYDINCGVRLLASTVDAVALRPHLPRLMDALYRNVPTGVGASGAMKLSVKELRAVLEKGAEWALSRGYATEEDLRHTEDGGRLAGADADAVSERALERGRDQVGTLGAGNHFLEVDEIVEVFDERVAQALGLVVGRVCVWIHCGSRGLGHQVCTDAVRVMQRAAAQYGIQPPDRELASVPYSSPEAAHYVAGMNAAANFAWANRQVIAHLVRQSFEEALAGKLAAPYLRQVYDVCHNIAKVEEHEVDGKQAKVCVHRKGATRAFGAGDPHLPDDYRPYGQPVLVPGNMGDGSYVLVGTETAMRETFGSSCHGAGRIQSRSAARKAIHGGQLREQLEAAQIAVRAGSMVGLAEEAPGAYKDLDRVVNVVHEAGLARRVARTRPLGVIKG